MKSIKDFIGYSEFDMRRGLESALEQAGNPRHYEIIETQGCGVIETKRCYGSDLKHLASKHSLN